MLDGLIRFVLHNRFLIILAGILLLASGFYTWKHLPIDAFPDVTNVQVMIISESLGLAPQEVERLVTFPIEVEMGGLPGIKQVRSLSKSGLSQVIVIFDDDTDTYFARQLVFERLASAKEKLPEGITPELGPISTGLGEIYQYALESGYYCKTHPDIWSKKNDKCAKCNQELIKSKYDMIDLRTMQNWLITPQLRRLSGINEVNSFGGFVKQFHVIPNPDLLLKYDISLHEITEALEANNSNTSGGFIVKDWEQTNIVTKGLIQNISDIEQIVIKASDGTPVYLKDVASIRIGSQIRNGAVSKDGNGETVIGMAIMLRGSNSKEVVDRVKKEIPNIQKTLPQGVKIIPFYDRTDLIQACISTISDALWQGTLFVILILFIILWDLRAAFIVTLAIPITVAIAFILMGWQGVTANLMSLGGLAIALGMIVDGPIVITENIIRHMREKSGSDQSKTAITFEAVKEVISPMSFAILIIIIVFLPLFSLESMEGKMFKPLALTMCFAMLGSLISCILFMPAFGSLMIKRGKKEEKENLLIRGIQKIYLPILSIAMKGRWITIAVVCSTIIGVALVIPKIGTEFLPALDEGSIAINAVRLPTASLEGSAIQVSEIEKHLLKKFPEITTVISKTGRAEIAEDPMGPEQTDILIMLKPKNEWKSAGSKEELIKMINKELSLFPGIRLAFSQPISLRVNELISGIKSDVAIKIFGNDIETLGSIGKEIASIIPGIKGASDVKIEQVSGFSQIEIEMNKETMAKHKINISDINSLIETAIGGKAATTVYEGQKRFDVFVRFPLEYRNNISDIKNLLIKSPQGYKVPLSELINVKEVEVPAQISRENSGRRFIVECNVRGRDIGSFVEEAKLKLTELERKIPQGYRFEWGGQFENQQRAMERLKIIVPISLLLIFLLLYSSLNSFKSAALVLINLPFALVGGIMAIYFMKINLSVAASIGFIALLGCAVENGLVLVSFFDQLQKEGKTVIDAVITACKLRVRPLLMTTLTTLLGLFPMMYSTGAGSEIQKPLVTVIFGGLVSSLILTLIILPVIYAVFNGYKGEEEIKY